MPPLSRFSGPRRHRARLPALSGARKAVERQDRHPRAWLVGIERLASMRWPTRLPRAAWKPMRLTFAAMAARAPVATSPMLGQLEDDWPILSRWSARSSPDRALTLLGHSAGGGFALRDCGIADPGSVRAHRAACALSRLQRPDQPAATPAAGPVPTFRASSGWRRCARSASIAATRCRRSPSRCRRIPNEIPRCRTYSVSPDAQFRRPRELSRRFCRCAPADHDILWRR